MRGPIYAYTILYVLPVDIVAFPAPIGYPIHNFLLSHISNLLVSLMYFIVCFIALGSPSNLSILSWPHPIISSYHRTLLYLPIIRPLLYLPIIRPLLYLPIIEPLNDTQKWGRWGAELCASKLRPILG